jgi:hypothetical protein
MFILLVFLAAPPRLFSASIINEGETTAKVNARSNQGITGGGSIKPGQSLHLKDGILWIEHVPEGVPSPVRLKIIQNDGTTGYISTSGGRYVFQQAEGTRSAAETEKKTRTVLTEGHAENRSNLTMLLSLIAKGNRQSYLLLLPAQKAVIPKDTVEVIADRHGWSSGDIQIALFLTMPDGKEHIVRTEHTVIRVDPDDVTG